MATKKSTGIILFDNNFSKVLLINKRTTYAYMDFVFGKYDKGNSSAMIKMFNRMTLAEKVIVGSMDFNTIWYYLFLNNKKTSLFYRSKSKFESCFIDNGGRYLQTLLNASNINSNTLWEPPKGRKNKKESNITCAMRETFEETNIKYDSYKIIPGEKITITIVGSSMTYKIIYYIAQACPNLAVNLQMNNKTQIAEIAAAKWIPIHELGRYTMINEIRQAITAKHKELRSDYKKYKDQEIYASIF